MDIMERKIITVLTLFLAAASLPLPGQSFAATNVFEREYTYQASEADSKLSCRIIALEQVKRLLLEELGTYLQSISEVKSFVLTKDEIVSLTAGIVRTEIVSETWDGRVYRLKARIKADPNQVIEAISRLRQDHQKTKDLAESQARAKQYLKEIERLKQELAKVKGEDLRRKQIEYKQAVKNLSAEDWFELAPERLNWRKIAILPFTGKPVYRELSGGVFYFSIGKQQHFEIIGPATAENELKKEGTVLSVTKIGQEEAQEAGRLLGADAVIVGYVTMKTEQRYDAEVGVSLVDIGTGQNVVTSIRSIPIRRNEHEAVTSVSERVADDMLSLLHEVATVKGLPTRETPVYKKVPPIAKKEGHWTGNINLFLGKKSIDDDEWEDLEIDEHNQEGIKLDFKKKDWPVSIAIDYFRSNNSNGQNVVGGWHFEGETYELTVGVRKIWDNNPVMRPFIGGGLARVEGWIKKETRTFPLIELYDKDAAIGVWLEGGVYWALGGLSGLNLGLNARWSSAEVTLFGKDNDIGGIKYGALIGYHW